MKPCAYCGRENADDADRCQECGTQFVDPPADAQSQKSRAAIIETLRMSFRDLSFALTSRWSVGFLGFVVLAVAVALFLNLDHRTWNAPGIVVLSTCYSNGEQRVTFRPEPANAEISFAGVISDSEDASVQPPTVRSFGQVFPAHDPRQTNYSLHFVAVPFPRASMGGKPLTYTPGSYTVAYTPTDNAHRVRVGVALPQKGIGDYVRRLRNCREQMRLTPLLLQSHRDPVFVTIEPITNAATSSRKSSLKSAIR